MQCRPPSGSGKSSELNSPRGLQQREMSAVATRAAMVVRPAVLVRVNFNGAANLERGEVHQHQQHKQETQYPQWPRLWCGGLTKYAHIPNGHWTALSNLRLHVLF